jgi:hypothetical protein
MRFMTTHIFLMTITGCAPSYVIERNTFHRSQEHPIDEVRARRSTDGRAVLLKPGFTFGAQVEEELGPQHVRVRLSNPVNTAGGTMLVIGGMLLSTSILVGALMHAPGNTYEGESWVGPTMAAVTLGTIGGPLMLAGGITLGATTRRAEVREPAQLPRYVE